MQQQEDYYDSLYHLAEVSVFKLNNPTTSDKKEPTLRRQLLVKNILVLSSHLLTSNQPTTQEEVWLNACFDELIDEDEDAFMEEQETTPQLKLQESKDDNLLVVAFPFDYISTAQATPTSSQQHHTIQQKDGNTTLFFM